MTHKIKHYTCISFFSLKTILILNNLFTTNGGVSNNSDSFIVQCKSKSKVIRPNTINAERGKKPELSFLTLEPHGVCGQIRAPDSSLVQNEPTVPTEQEAGMA